MGTVCAWHGVYECHKFLSLTAANCRLWHHKPMREISLKPILQKKRRLYKILFRTRTCRTLFYHKVHQHHLTATTNNDAVPLQTCSRNTQTHWTKWTQSDHKVPWWGLVGPSTLNCPISSAQLLMSDTVHIIMLRCPLWKACHVRTDDCAKNTLNLSCSLPLLSFAYILRFRL